MTDYIKFVETAAPKGYKTKVWNVVSKSSEGTLGTIRWYAPWRQYCFYPSSGTVWSRGCLMTVLSFCNEQMRKRRDWSDDKRSS